jgi:hypothetical protein
VSCWVCKVFHLRFFCTLPANDLGRNFTSLFLPATSREVAAATVTTPTTVRLDDDEDGTGTDNPTIRAVAIGAFVGWATAKPRFDDSIQSDDCFVPALLGATISGSLGTSRGAAVATVTTPATARLDDDDDGT